MPTAWWGNIEQIIGLVHSWKPKTILDVGIGFGRWGFLLREYLDIYGRVGYNKEDWQVKIDGIEVWAKYILPHHNYLYDNIYIGDCVEILPILSDYNLIIMTDVLEHIEKERGKNFLNTLCKKGQKCILQVPLGDWKQGLIFDNPYERHLSVWEKEDFINLPNIRIFNIKQPYHGKNIALIVLDNKNG